jgi:hypothetical protein
MKTNASKRPSRRTWFLSRVFGIGVGVFILVLGYGIYRLRFADRQADAEPQAARPVEQRSDRKQPNVGVPKASKRHVQPAPDNGRVVNVDSQYGGDLQEALDHAQPGEILELTAGKRYAGSRFGGSINVPNRATANGTITIRSSKWQNLPPPGTGRVGPADAANMPQIISSGGGAFWFYNGTDAAHADTGVGWYTLQGLEITQDKPNVSEAYGLIALGNNGGYTGSYAYLNQDTLARQPHDILIDRCYLHMAPKQTTGGPYGNRGISIHGANLTIRGCYIANLVTASSSDTQAINVVNGSGPVRITNNYLEGATENFICGGSPTLIRLNPVLTTCTQMVSPGTVTLTPAAMKGTLSLQTPHGTLPGQNWWIIPGVAVQLDDGANTESATVLATTATTFTCACTKSHRGTFTIAAPNMDLVPAHFEIDHNLIAKPFTWNPKHPSYDRSRWKVKNLFELKSGSQFNVHDNTLSHCFHAAQTGGAVLFTPRGRAPGNAQGGPWTGIDNIRFCNNVVEHCVTCFQIKGTDDASLTTNTHDILIQNNLFDDIGDQDAYGHNYQGTTIGSSSRIIQLDQGMFSGEGPEGLRGGTDNLVIDHNTFIAGAAYSYNTMLLLGSGANTGYHRNLRLTNNILPFGKANPTGIYNSDEPSARVAAESISAANWTGIQSKNSGCGGTGQFAGNGWYGLGGTVCPPSVPWLAAAGSTDLNTYVADVSKVLFHDFHNGKGGDYALAAASPFKYRGTDRKDPGRSRGALGRLWPADRTLSYSFRINETDR